MNIDIKLKLSEIIDYLKKETPDMDIKKLNLNSIFSQANTNKKNDEIDEQGNRIEVLSGNEINQFFDIAFSKFKDTTYEIYEKLCNFKDLKTSEMWKSVERDLSEDESADLNKLETKQDNLLKNSSDIYDLLKELRNSMGLTAAMVAAGKTDAVETFKEMQKQEEELKKMYDDENRMIKFYSTEIQNLKYDENKIDTSKYTDLDKEALENLENIEKWTTYHTSRTVPSYGELQNNMRILQEYIDNDNILISQKAKVILDKLVEFFPAALEDLKSKPEQHYEIDEKGINYIKQSLEKLGYSNIDEAKIKELASKFDFNKDLNFDSYISPFEADETTAVFMEKDDKGSMIPTHILNIIIKQYTAENDGKNQSQNVEEKLTVDSYNWNNIAKDNRISINEQKKVFNELAIQEYGDFANQYDLDLQSLTEKYAKVFIKDISIASKGLSKDFATTLKKNYILDAKNSILCALVCTGKQLQNLYYAKMIN